MLSGPSVSSTVTFCVCETTPLSVLIQRQYRLQYLISIDFRLNRFNSRQTDINKATHSIQLQRRTRSILFRKVIQIATMLSTMKIRNNLKAKEYRRRDIEILPKYNRTTYLVEGNNIYNKRYDRNGVTTWECCSNSFCGGRLLSRHNEFFKESTDHATYCKGNAAKIEEKKFHGMAYQLCKDTVTPRTYNQIYGLISLAYPRVAMRFSKKEMTSTLVTWKYGMARLPNTIEELNCAMNDPELYEKYGKNTFGDFTIEEPGYRCYDDVYETQFVGDDNLLQTSKIVAFRCYTSVEHVRGTRVDLAGDGSAGPCPVNVAFKKLLFDDLQQLYVVHMIIHKKVKRIYLFIRQIHSPKTTTRFSQHLVPSCRLIFVTTFEKRSLRTAVSNCPKVVRRRRNHYCYDYAGLRKSISFSRPLSLAEHTSST